MEKEVEVNRGGGTKSVFDSRIWSRTLCPLVSRSYDRVANGCWDRNALLVHPEARGTCVNGNNALALLFTRGLAFVGSSMAVAKEGGGESRGVPREPEHELKF